MPPNTVIPSERWPKAPARRRFLLDSVAVGLPLMAAGVGVGVAEPSGVGVAVAAPAAREVDDVDALVAEAIERNPELEALARYIVERKR